MAKYLGSKTKLSRKIGRNLFLKGSRSYSAKDDYTKRSYKPGQHGKSRFSKVSEYGKQLLEKQTLRFFYGLQEKQLGNLFKKAFKKTGDTGLTALGWLERRLDNVIYRAGLANSRSQARQLVNHGHFTVNGTKVNIPSFMVSEGDIITIKENKLKIPFWQNFTLEVPNTVPSWLDGSKKNVVTVLKAPTDQDLPQEFKLPLIVEYYSQTVA